MLVMSSEFNNSNAILGFKSSLPSYRAVSSSKMKSYKFDTLNSLPCKYGEIVYSVNSHEPHYSLHYGNYEVDIDYTKDYLDGYSLKVALYKNGAMVSYLNDICYDLPNGIVSICERILDAHINKN